MEIWMWPPPLGRRVSLLMLPMCPWATTTLHRRCAKNVSVVLFAACLYLKFEQNYQSFIKLNAFFREFYTFKYDSDVAFHRVTSSYSLEMRAVLLLSSKEGIKASICPASLRWFWAVITESALLLGQSHHSINSKIFLKRLVASESMKTSTLASLQLQ